MQQTFRKSRYRAVPNGGQPGASNQTIAFDSGNTIDASN